MDIAVIEVLQTSNTNALIWINHLLGQKFALDLRFVSEECFPFSSDYSNT